jgi:hypothetical protein
MEKISLMHTIKNMIPLKITKKMIHPSWDEQYEGTYYDKNCQTSNQAPWQGHQMDPGIGYPVIGP